MYEVEGKQLHWNLKRHVQGLLDERTTNGAEAWPCRRAGGRTRGANSLYMALVIRFLENHGFSMTMGRGGFPKPHRTHFH